MATERQPPKTLRFNRRSVVLWIIRARRCSWSCCLVHCRHRVRKFRFTTNRCVTDDSNARRCSSGLDFQTEWGPLLATARAKQSALWVRASAFFSLRSRCWYQYCRHSSRCRRSSIFSASYLSCMSRTSCRCRPCSLARSSLTASITILLNCAVTSSKSWLRSSRSLDSIFLPPSPVCSRTP
ncbi:hypothetical protein DIPPA_00936 [Diplonema papillatum]|nr:hypothetical protein DIPPA_00936 [Diplonema papillatum]